MKQERSEGLPVAAPTCDAFSFGSIKRLKVRGFDYNAMGDFIGLCAIVIVALSPLLRRFYIDRFWVHGRGTVIRLEVGRHL